MLNLFTKEFKSLSEKSVNIPHYLAKCPRWTAHILVNIPHYLTKCPRWIAHILVNIPHYLAVSKMNQTHSCQHSTLPGSVQDELHTLLSTQHITWQSVQDESHTLCKHAHHTVSMWTISCNPREEHRTIISQLLYPGSCWFLQAAGPVWSEPWREHFGQHWPQLLTHCNTTHIDPVY